MSVTSIEAHNQKWDALPAFPAWPYVMTDDDVDAWGDLLYLRGLVDAVVDICARTGARIPATDHRSVEFDIDTYLEPWPTADAAAELLADWKQTAA
jgi:hypothetical protein